MRSPTAMRRSRTLRRNSRPTLAGHGDRRRHWRYHTRTAGGYRMSENRLGIADHGLIGDCARVPNWMDDPDMLRSVGKGGPRRARITVDGPSAGLTRLGDPVGNGL